MTAKGRTGIVDDQAECGQNRTSRKCERPVPGASNIVREATRQDVVIDHPLNYQDLSGVEFEWSLFAAIRPGAVLGRSMRL